MKNRTLIVTLAIMLLVLVFSAAFVIHLQNRHNALATQEAALLAEDEEARSGEHGFQTINEAKLPLWEKRDELLNLERELQAQIADLKTSSDRIRNQLTVLAGRQQRRDQARARTAILQARIDALTPLRDRLAAIRAVEASLSSGEITAEEARARLAELNTANAAPSGETSADSGADPAAEAVLPEEPAAGMAADEQPPAESADPAGETAASSVAEAGPEPAPADDAVAEASADAESGSANETVAVE